MRSLIILVLLVVGCSGNKNPERIEWNNWNSGLFERAAQQNKLVLLDVKANWCHWCHVMDDSTYTNAEVVEYLNKHFIVAEADHDARPDLAARYRKWGWPATIVFNASGDEVLKKAGFMNPQEFLAVLKDCVKNPVAEKKVSKNKVVKTQGPVYFAQSILPGIKKRCNGILDIKIGGFNNPMKYIDWDAFEYSLTEYANNPELKTWLKNTIYNSRGLVDKEWGGVYQYSTFSDWQHPHYEKLLRNQARYINVYTWYGKEFNDTAILTVAEKIAGYCFEFLWNEGKGFYNAQDADLTPGKKATWYYHLNDSERRKKGIPAIDKHIYTATNAQMIKSLVILWGATGKYQYLNAAREITDYFIANRKSTDGGYRHDDVQDNMWTLTDNLPMADALLMMYRATAEQKYLNESVLTAEFIHTTFRLPEGSYRSDVTENGLEPNVVYKENMDVCRFFNLLSYASNNPEFKQYANLVFTWLTSPGVVENLTAEHGLLLAYTELNTEPLNGTFLEIEKTDESKNMIRELVSNPRSYFINHTYAKNTLPTEKRELLGSFNSNILFFCTSEYCSSPLDNENDLKKFLSKR